MGPVSEPPASAAPQAARASRTITAKEEGHDAMRGAPASMMENIRVLVAQKVQPASRRQEREARLGEIESALAHQRCFQPSPQRVQIQYVRRGVSALFGGQIQCAPVRGLLLLGQIDTQKFLAQVLEAVPVGERADQLSRDFGA